MGQKFAFLATHFSAVMHGSKNLNFWLLIPTLYCMGQKNQYICITFHRCNTWVQKFAILATHSSTDGFLMCFFWLHIPPHFFSRLHIPPLKCSSHRNLKMCNHLSIELYTNDYTALCNRMTYMHIFLLLACGKHGSF